MTCMYQKKVEVGHKNDRQHGKRKGGNEEYYSLLMGHNDKTRSRIEEMKEGEIQIRSGEKIKE